MKREIGRCLVELPFRSDQAPCGPIMVGLAAPVVLAVDPPHPREVALAGASASWLSGSPIRQGRETSWSVGPKPRVMLILAVSRALSLLPTAHRWLFSTCQSQKQNPCQLRSNNRAICLWASRNVQFRSHPPSLEFLFRRSGISDFPRRSPAPTPLWKITGINVLRASPSMSTGSKKLQDHHHRPPRLATVPTVS